MPKKKIYFIGLLANVDSSVLKVNLDHNFNIRKISDKEGAELIAGLENLPFMAVWEKLYGSVRCLNSEEKEIYYVDNSFEADYKESINIVGTDSSLMHSVMNFDRKSVYGYLDLVIQLMRLFKEGNICMPLTYYYYIEGDKPISWFRVHSTSQILYGPYSLEISEIPNLQKFIKDTHLPFKEPSLQLAFESFELSYKTPDPSLSFVSLMIGLEALFTPQESRGELRYRISRNTAVLLGETPNDSKKIYTDMKELYNERSNIVHGGKLNVGQEDLLKLRNYLRKSIKEFYKIGGSKDELLELLNTCGFGQRAWTNGSKT